MPSVTSIPMSRWCEHAAISFARDPRRLRNAGRKPPVILLRPWPATLRPWSAPPISSKPMATKPVPTLCATHADFLESHLEKWTVTQKGTLVPGITRHYIRINPGNDSQNGFGDEDPDVGTLCWPISARATATSIPPTRLSMPAFSSWCALEFGKPEIL